MRLVLTVSLIRGPSIRLIVPSGVAVSPVIIMVVCARSVIRLLLIITDASRKIRIVLVNLITRIILTIYLTTVITIMFAIMRLMSTASLIISSINLITRVDVV